MIVIPWQKMSIFLGKVELPEAQNRIHNRGETKPLRQMIYGKNLGNTLP